MSCVLLDAREDYGAALLQLWGFFSMNCPGKTLNSTYTCYREVSIIESVGGRYSLIRW